MGIGWTLQGADAADSARDPLVSMPGWVPIEGSLDSGCVCARFADGWRAVSKRTLGAGRFEVRGNTTGQGPGNVFVPRRISGYPDRGAM